MKNLMLREYVAGAIHNGNFHIHSVATIDEGIEILTVTRRGNANLTVPTRMEPSMTW